MANAGETLKQVVMSLPFVKNHGIEITAIGAGRCTARMPFDPEHATPPANFPAAMVGMLGDVAGITACISALKPGQLCSTMDYTIKMTGAADGEALEAEAEALGTGKTVATGQSLIYSVAGDERKLCAVVLVSGRIIGSRQG